MARKPSVKTIRDAVTEYIGITRGDCCASCRYYTASPYNGANCGRWKLPRERRTYGGTSKYPVNMEVDASSICDFYSRDNGKRYERDKSSRNNDLRQDMTVEDYLKNMLLSSLDPAAIASWRLRKGQKVTEQDVELVDGATNDAISKAKSMQKEMDDAKADLDRRIEELKAIQKRFSAFMKDMSSE